MTRSSCQRCGRPLTRRIYIDIGAPEETDASGPYGATCARAVSRQLVKAGFTYVWRHEQSGRGPAEGASV